MGNRPLHLRDLGKPGRYVAEWLAEHGYEAGPVHKNRHWRFEVTREGVVRMGTLAGTPRDGDFAADRCIRQIIRAFERSAS